MTDFYRGKKILVAGGTGTIGSSLVRKLVLLGANITVVSIDNQDRVKSVLKGINVNFKYGDLTSYETCIDSTKNQDYVFNLVCIKGSTQIKNSFVATVSIPLLIANTFLMKASLNNGIKRYMFVGSINEYPNIPVRHEDSLWDGPPMANDRFSGIVKRVGEEQGEAYRLQYGWDATRIVRLSNVYGPWDNFDPKTAQVIPSLISRAINGENPLKIAGHVKTQRDFIFVEDAVDGMLLAMEKAPPCFPINLGSGRGTFIKEVVEIICDIINKNTVIKWDKNRPRGDLSRILNINRAKDVLNFEPIISLREGIRITIEWYKKNKTVADTIGLKLHGK